MALTINYFWKLFDIEFCWQMGDAVEGKECQFSMECNSSSKHEIPSDREEVCLDLAAMFCDSTYMYWIIPGLTVWTNIVTGLEIKTMLGHLLVTNWINIVARCKFQVASLYNQNNVRVPLVKSDFIRFGMGHIHVISTNKIRKQKIHTSIVQSCPNLKSK